MTAEAKQDESELKTQLAKEKLPVPYGITKLEEKIQKALSELVQKIQKHRLEM